MPKTLIFAKDDSHAEDIVRIVREEFGKGNDFAQKTEQKLSDTRPLEKNPTLSHRVLLDHVAANGTDDQYLYQRRAERPRVEAHQRPAQHVPTVMLCRGDAEVGGSD